MEWDFSLLAWFLLSLLPLQFHRAYFGIEQSLREMDIASNGYSLVRSVSLLLSRILSFWLELFQFVYPSTMVFFSSLWVASVSFWPPSQLGGTNSSEWLQTAALVTAFICAIIAVIISIAGYRKIDSEASRAGVEATETIAKLVIKVMLLENEMNILKAENNTLRARVVELESKLPKDQQ